MDTSRINFLKWSSWASLILPLLAYGLCSAVSTGHLFFHAPSAGISVGRLRYYAFLVSAIIGGFALIGDIGFKQRRLFLLSLLGLVLTYSLYTETAWFTGFID